LEDPGNNNGRDFKAEFPLKEKVEAFTNLSAIFFTKAVWKTG
jgi:hypothetical protein